MEPRFQVETRHDADAYRNMAAVHYIRHRKNKHTALMLYILGALLAALVWYMAANGNFRSMRALGTGIFTLAICWLLTPYIDRFSSAQVCRRLADTLIKGAKKSGTLGLPTRYRFYDDRMDAADKGGCVETRYSALTDLVETKQYFLLFDGDGKCILARKSDFTQGDPKELPAFLAAACGRSMEYFEMADFRRR